MSLRIKKALSFVLMLAMLLSMGSGFAAQDGQTTVSEPVIPGLAVVQAGDAPVAAAAVYTVTFDIGAQAIAAGVSAPAAVQVESGKTLESLPAVSWQNESGATDYVFAGWYQDAAYKTEFTAGDAITQDITVYAKWVSPQDPNMYYVNFFSQDGQTVLLTVAVSYGRTTSSAEAIAIEGKIFRGWSMTTQGDQDISKLNAFNFATPVSSVATDNTLNLYAWYGDEVTVAFVANGGTAVPTLRLAKGETATAPVTTRTGYTFQGWSSNKDSMVAYNFNTPVNENITLYAFWSADMVPVKLVYMFENANDDGYSPAGIDSTTVYAPAGSYLSIQKSTITSIGQTHSVVYSSTNGGAQADYAKTSATGNRNATIADVQSTYFQYNSATNNRFVMPDGSTVVLLYYNRVRVTLTFSTPDAVWNSSDNSYDSYTEFSATIANLDTKVSPETQAAYSVTYTTARHGYSSYTGFKYAFTAKYGQDISTVWPQIGWVTITISSTQREFYGWYKPKGTSKIQSSNKYELDDELFSSCTIENGILVAKQTLPAVTVESLQNVWLIYARTTLPGETADFTYNGKNYTVYTEACQLGKASGGLFGYKQLFGCTSISGTPVWRNQYKGLIGNSFSVDGKTVTVASGTMKDKFDSVFANESIDDDDWCQVLLYDRSTISLTLTINDDTYGTNDQSARYLYGDWIYNEDADLLKTVEKDMAKDGYVFAGWFTTPEFTPGTEYVPDENSRIEGHMHLYAKWEPNQFRAEYYLFTDDTTPYATQGFAEGGTIDDKLVPVAVQGSFVGWYWYQNGQLEPFDFSSTVGQAHVDENGVLKLYAKWTGENGRVSYLPGIGGDNATQEVLDLKDYVINSASVHLPQYGEVWTDGSVPADKSLTFVGWKASNGAIYQPGRYVKVTRMLMQFEAQWSSDAVKLIYNANGGDGADVTENWARDSVVGIWDNMDGTNPHFTRDNYELIGWDENPTATAPTYQLGKGTIKLSKDTTTLYAIWRPLTVEIELSKTVSGNMGIRSLQFAFTVAYEDGTPIGSYSLAHGESVTFSADIGKTIIVTEADNEYDTTYSVDGGTAQSGKTAEVAVTKDTKTIAFNNDKEVTISSGVLLDSLPYVLILALVVAGAGLYVVSRRRRRDD